VNTAILGPMALTAKQEAFAQHYAQHRNGTAAYRHAYDVAPETLDATCATKASELLANGEISARIDAIIAAVTKDQPVTMTLAECFARWFTMATADRNELIGLKVGACRHCWGEGHGYQWKQHEYLAAMDEWERAAKRDPELPMPDIAGGLGYRKTRAPNEDCPVCEGEGVERIVARDTSKLSPAAKMIYGGVKQTRNGIELIVADQTKCLENASRIIGAFTDKVRLDGSLSAMVAAVNLNTADPNEAAKAYMEMVNRVAAK